jgi:C4-dicarboxylate transporter, DctM subunit
LLPGLVMGVLMCLAVYIEVRAKGIGGAPAAFSIAELGRATWNCKYGLGAPAIILGGIYSGVFTPTEAAAVAVVYCIVVEMFVNRAVGWRDLGSLFARSGVIIGLIGPVIIFSLMFGEVIALLRLPEAIANTFLTHASDRNTFLICVLLLLLLVGCFMETIAALLILMPILIPVVKAMGIDPVHFGVFSVCALTIGFITPPVGLNLFVASAISGRPYMSIAGRVVPLFSALVVATILVGWVPWLSLWFR